MQDEGGRFQEDVLDLLSNAQTWGDTREVVGHTTVYPSLADWADKLDVGFGDGRRDQTQAFLLSPQESGKYLYEGSLGKIETEVKAILERVSIQRVGYTKLCKDDPKLDDQANGKILVQYDNNEVGRGGQQARLRVFMDVNQSPIADVRWVAEDDQTG